MSEAWQVFLSTGNPVHYLQYKNAQVGELYTEPTIDEAVREYVNTEGVSFS